MSEFGGKLSRPLHKLLKKRHNHKRMHEDEGCGISGSALSAGNMEEHYHRHKKLHKYIK